jgi:hypothetical protein
MLSFWKFLGLIWLDSGACELLPCPGVYIHVWHDSVEACHHEPDYRFLIFVLVQVVEKLVHGGSSQVRGEIQAGMLDNIACC